MALRSNWKGYLKISLVSIPIKTFSAVNADEGRVHLHQLHSKCHNRIKYVKTCPTHGPVPNSEIVTGYEYAKGEYVIITEDEIDQMRSADDKAITVVTVIPEESLDPIYLTDHSSYLVPDGSVGNKAFVLVQKILTEQKRSAIGRMIRQGRDIVTLIRPVNDVLLMTELNNVANVRLPEVLESEMADVQCSAEELKLTRTLVDSFHHDSVDLSQFHDHYSERVTELVEARVAGHKVVAPTEQEEPHVISLMDALRKSVEQSKSTRVQSSAEEKPKKRTAKPKTAAASKRKKTG